ncbi:CPBP family intramembrane glutamic endopeptidase [Enterococcus termitis]|uniref:CAAX prenyl protease 2/Lysostaphin resistance protein A-like domain-containing protein n=1 Tax=Enterococcus termitis TaxID=332950 RepID=A0A1E5GJI5_9ENTE|nr:type II CAAX endopeptidase family protein [Enterococcus termitis]OEG12858.1 hypothetical protein BCR25_05030 [Enterococcus termitis]OJG96630.1 hypothetical protein RV18_GL002064 [Enterococcus termitis]
MKKVESKSSVLIVLIGYLIISQVPMGTIQLFTKLQKNISKSVEFFVISLLCFVICFGLITWQKQRKIALWNFRGLFKTIPWIILACAFCFLGSAAGQFLIEQQGLEQTINQVELKKLLDQTPKGLFLLVTGVTAPITEEGIYRAGIQALFPEKYKYRVMIGAAVLFSFSHTPTNIGSFIVYFSFGLAFGGVYLKTGRIEAAVLAHGLWNMLGVMVM